MVIEKLDYKKSYVLFEKKRKILIFPFFLFISLKVFKEPLKTLGS